MTLETFLANGFSLRAVAFVRGGPLVAVVCDHLTEPVIHQGQFTVQYVGETPTTTSDDAPTIVEEFATYAVPKITAISGAVFDASQYEMR